MFLNRVLGREAKDASAAALVSVVFAFYAAEAYITFLSPEPARAEIQYSAAHDCRSMREVVSQLRQSGDPQAVPILYPSYLLTRPDLFIGRRLELDGTQFLPLSGISMRNTVLCNESGDWASYSSDEFGFRNPRGLWGSSIDVA